MAHIIGTLGVALFEASKLVRHAASLQHADRLFFPTELTYIRVGAKTLVLSPTTANWLVVNDKELDILKLLISGETVGQVSEWAKRNLPTSSESLHRVFGQIITRNFACTDAPPIGIVDTSLKNGAYFYLTNACNLRCTHCYMSSGSAANQELSIDEWVSIVDQFSEIGGHSITFSGGEVLAKKNWSTIVKHAKRKDLSVTILTNGTLWTDYAIKDISPYVDEVQISLDGPSENINSLTRGSDFFFKALDSAKKFDISGVRTSIAMTPTRNTIRLFESELYEFFKKNIQGTHINIRISQKLLPTRDGTKLSEKEQTEYQKISSKLSNILYPTATLRSFSINHQPNIIQTNCGLGGISISSTGEVYPCNRISDIESYGDVRKETLSEIISRLKKIELFTNIDSIDTCRICDFRYICGGGCRIDDFYIQNKHGDTSSLRNFQKNQTSKIIRKKCSQAYKTSLIEKLINVTDYIFPENGNS